MTANTLKLTASLALLRSTIYHLAILSSPPPQSPDAGFRLLVTTCLCTSALLSAELVGSCLHP